MRSFLSLSLLFLTSILFGVVQAVTLNGRDQCDANAEICQDPQTLTQSKRQTTSTRPFFQRNLTNAQRLARRLPLKPPARRRASPVIAARQSQTSALPPVTYSGVIQVFSGTSSLGYVAPDPNYWTPLLTPDISSALSISFQLPEGATSGSQLNMNELNDNRGALFAPVVGRDSTSSDIAPGNFNYFYLDPTAAPGTLPGDTPQSTPSFFASSSGLDKQTETSVWSVDLVAGTLSAQWINTDSSSPTTVFFVQSNHLYAGGDADAFHSRFPAPVSTVTLQFVAI